VSASETSLPAGFEALAPFVPGWDAPDADGRLRARLRSSEAERLAFFGAAQPLLADALAYLDSKPLAAFDAAEARLMRLLLAFAHVALAVETQGDDEPKHADAAQHMTITRAPADRQACPWNADT
jgi:hypothetical protein